MRKKIIPFNKPFLTGNEIKYINKAHINGQLSGDGPFTIKCHEWIENFTQSKRTLVTHSCTAALEMTAILANIKYGDEIIMPSYTFVSTANAFVLRGAIPVFIDIREDTLNLNEKLIDSAITSKTKAIIPVHYAGISCEMDTILDISKRNNLLVIEDAAQSFMSTYKGKPLGSIGDFGAYSFHETKNIISGEGGALIINNVDYVKRSEIIREKGTDRTQFFRGLIDKYTWQDLGSSFLPGELVAAFLLAQLESADELIRKRIEIWNNYHKLLKPLEDSGFLRRPIVPTESKHNGHMYYILLPSKNIRQEVIDYFKKNNIQLVTHYIPLHSSPAGLNYGKVHGDMALTNELSQRILRLPMWIGLTYNDQENIFELFKKYYRL